MFATHSLSQACDRLDSAISIRLFNVPRLDEFEIVRYPVGLFFLRGNRAGGAKNITEQVVASYDYWNDDSGEYFDMVFPGWGNDGGYIDFNQNAFRNFQEEVKALSMWAPTGETELLLLNYDYRIIQWQRPRAFIGKGEFSFEEAIIFPIEQMLRDGRIGSLDGFIQEMINSAKGEHVRSEESVIIALRDKVAVSKARNAIWEGLKHFALKDFSNVFDVLSPFQIKDLRKRR